MSMAMVALRLSDELKEVLEEDAEKSGWSVSEQIRYELMERRGMVRKPYLPSVPAQDAPVRRSAKTPNP